MLPRTLLLATLMALAACMKTAAMPSLTLCAPLRFGNASDDDARTLAAVASWMQLGDTPPAVLLFADDDGSACAAFEAAIGGIGGAGGGGAGTASRNGGGAGAAGGGEAEAAEGGGGEFEPGSGDGEMEPGRGGGKGTHGRRPSAPTTTTAPRCLTACAHPTEARLDLACMLTTARRLAPTPALCMINSDIVLGPDFWSAVDALSYARAAAPSTHVLVVGRRTDVQITGRELIELMNGGVGEGDEGGGAAVTTEVGPVSPARWRSTLLAKAEAGGSLHSPYGMDYLLASPGFWDAVPMPPFLVGLYRWDSHVVAQVTGMWGLLGKVAGGGPGQAG